MGQFSFAPTVSDDKAVSVAVTVNTMATNPCGLTFALHLTVGADTTLLCADTDTFRAVAEALCARLGAWLESNPKLPPGFGTFEAFDRVLLDGEVQGEVLRVLPDHRAIVLVGDNPLTVPFYRLHKAD